MVFILSLIFLSRSNTWQRRGVRESEILKNVHGNVTCDSLLPEQTHELWEKISVCLLYLLLLFSFLFVCL